MRSVLSKFYLSMKLTRSSVVKQSPEAFRFLITEILDPCIITLNFYVLSLWQLACTLPHFCGCLRFLMVESYTIWPSMADFILYHFILKTCPCWIPPFKHWIFHCMFIQHFIFWHYLFCVCVHVCYAHTWRSETTCRSGSSTTWTPGMELKLSGLMAGAFTAVPGWELAHIIHIFLIICQYSLGLFPHFSYCEECLNNSLGADFCSFG